VALVEDDLDYVRRLLSASVLLGPVLELGTGYEGETCRGLVTRYGLKYVGTDLDEGPGVDVAANFESAADMAGFARFGPFGTVLVLNVLEHTFDPLRVMDNARSLLAPGGRLVLLTPAVWPLHSYPLDTWRILPNLYEQYAERNGLRLLRDHFEYVGRGPVDRFRKGSGYSLPPPWRSRREELIGRSVHRAFRTFGRLMFHPTHIAVAAVIEVP
jgi:SAM-dependent methyltransferase